MKPNPDALARVIDDCIRLCRFWAAAGIEGFACSENAIAAVRGWGKPAVGRRKPAGAPQGGPVPEAAVEPEDGAFTGQIEQNSSSGMQAETQPEQDGRSHPNESSLSHKALREDLSIIQADLGECTRCALGATRRRLVFGEGDPSARLMFVGEGPGRDEDLSGRPFVGAAGKLLTRMIQAMGFSREDVYICNIIKCRPPGNRNPLPEEVEACMPFLQRQIRSVAPDFICALGAVAARTLLQTEAPISRLRGRFHDANGIPVMPTYHPAYLLRNPEKKREVWEDVQAIMRKMGKLPGKSRNSSDA